MVIERVSAGGGEDAGLPHRAAEHAAVARRRGDRASREPASSEPPGAPSPFESATATRSNGARELGDRRCRWRRRVPEPRAVEEASRSPRSRAAAQMRSASSCGKTTPPARLCVFSISTSVVGG